jgi:hypothetical protein
MDALREGVAARILCDLMSASTPLYSSPRFVAQSIINKLQGTILKDYPFDALYGKVVESFIKSLSPSIRGNAYDFAVPPGPPVPDTPCPSKRLDARQEYES